MTSYNLEDAENKFMVEYGVEIDAYESKMVELLSSSPTIENLQAWLDTLRELQVFCMGKGVGGKQYYRSAWKGSRRVVEITNELNMAKKYTDGVDYEHAALEVYNVIRKNGPVSSTSIYRNCASCVCEYVSSVLRLLTKTGTIIIEKTEDGGKLYRLRDESSVG